MIRRRMRLPIALTAVFTVLSVLFPGCSAQSSRVLTGITAAVEMVFHDNYYMLPYTAVYDYIGGEGVNTSNWTTSPFIYEDPDLKRNFWFEPQEGTDYYFECTFYNPDGYPHAFDFSQLKAENCHCTVDGYYTATCIKVTVNQTNKGVSADIVFRIRKNESKVKSIRITKITEPVAGAYPYFTARERGTGYHIWKYTGDDWYRGVQWSDLTRNVSMTKDADRFRAGHTYRCYVLVETDGAGYEFANDGTKPTVNANMNGKEAEVYWNSTNDYRKRLWVYRDYTIPADQAIEYVNVLGVEEPAYGAKPDYYAEAPAGVKYSVRETHTEYRKFGVLWYDKTEQRNMSPSDPFEAGHVYEVSVVLVPDSGYVFALLDDGRLDVEATLNGDQAEVVDREYVSEIYDSEIEVKYTFSRVTAEISSVAVSFETPAAGQEPDWSMDAYGEGYRVETEYSSGTYINGVYWKDDTENRGMKQGDSFIAGHTYTVTVSLVTEEGYEFADYNNYELAAYLNGVHADSITGWDDPETNIGLKKTYTLSSDRLPGDANADGKVDMLDALRVVQYQEMAVPIKMANADVTGDGKATIEDARLIGQYAAGWNVGLK